MDDENVTPNIVGDNNDKLDGNNGKHKDVMEKVYRDILNMDIDESVNITSIISLCREMTI